MRKLVSKYISTFVCAACWVVSMWAVSSGGASAQEIAVSAARVEAGADFAISYSLPETDPARSYKLALLPLGADTIPASHVVSSPGQGEWRFPAPQVPGNYQAVIALLDADRPIRRQRVQVVVSPTPGALTLPKESFLGQEGTSVSVTLPEGRQYPNPWVGLFAVGQNMPLGGASVGDERLSWHWVQGDGSAVNFTLPRWPGVYEFRLFDRSEGPYVLDRKRVTVMPPPQPGILQLDKETYEVGAQVSVNVSPDAKLFAQTWIALTRAGREEGGGSILEQRLHWDWLNRETRTWQFAAPSTEGQFEVRIYDGDGQFYFEMDRQSFAVVAKPEEGAIKLAKTTFNVGEVIDVSVAYGTERGQYSSWVGLFELVDAATGGNAAKSVHRYGWEWVGNNAATKLTAPVWPGNYELRLYDRDGRHYMLDRQAITVVVPPVPEALTVSTRQLRIGQPFEVETTLPPGRAYPSPWISLTRLEAETSAGGAEITPRAHEWHWARTDGPVTFKGLPHPGRYRVRLFDREGGGYILDDEEIEVTVPVLSGAVQTDKPRYRTGEKIKVAVNLPAERQFGGAFVGMYINEETGTEGLKYGRNRIGHHWISVDGGPYEFEAPATEGTYQIIAFDRENGGYELGRTSVQVGATPVDLLRLSGRSFQPGAVIRLQTRVPAGLRLYDPIVKMMHASYVLENGVLAAEVPITSRHVNRTEGETFEVAAPQEPGKYEFRYYDRGGHFYILDIEEFEVAALGPEAARREHSRLTPMPGEGRRVTPNRADDPRETPQPETERREDQPETGPEDTSDSTEAPDVERDNEAADPNSDAPVDSTTDDPIDNAADDLTPDGPKLQVEALTEFGLRAVEEIAPGASFRVRVFYPLPPKEAPKAVQIGLQGGSTVTLPLKADKNAGVFVTDVMRVPMDGGE